MVNWSLAIAAETGMRKCHSLDPVIQLKQKDNDNNKCIAALVNYVLLYNTHLSRALTSAFFVTRALIKEEFPSEAKI
jgi:hypothetical protein